MVILDHAMPRLDGLEFLRHLRSGGDLKAQLPVIFLASAAHEAARTEAMKLGAVVLHKPVKTEELLAAVEKMAGSAL